MLHIGHAVVVLSATFFAVAAYAVLLSAFIPSTDIPLLDALKGDTHYKYFVILLVPTSAYFVIANWVGWQYYQNS
ncbi:hypothetical protein CC1G_04302 [Coprinopsis cinerea okayama7|uniref:Uncharacterized protein n=1 Tax=Coprinopsis cinerea (strain Okayama-7 / 130 / ATCC MYA-4618 / FGSC 9003) TaxID=240176 RepID=A8NFM5_COPC7|nr:hypothetical protein CC1G_04302 [Coprinopsis cinerea okayama7\|eukprot:XP_001833323.1 hypothetical protein CC1G_04302 [Coprinopsis cinerea okayama7\